MFVSHLCLSCWTRCCTLPHGTDITRPNQTQTAANGSLDDIRNGAGENSCSCWLTGGGFNENEMVTERCDRDRCDEPGIAGAEHLEQQFIKSVGRVARAWEAGRVDEQPPPGATGARGSVYVRDLVDRSLVFVCRHDRVAGEVVVVTLWEAEGGAAPPRVGRRWTDSPATRIGLSGTVDSGGTPPEGRAPWPSPRISSSSPTARSTRPSCWMPSDCAPSPGRST